MKPAGRRDSIAAMKKNHLLVSGLAVLAFGAGSASAGGSEGSIGVGAEFMLSGLGGMSANYDMGQFHVGGFLSFEDEDGDDNTDIALGGRFYYHLHSTAMSDFSVGGALGIGLIGDRNPAMDNNATIVYLEPGVQIRAFVASNVALSFSAGLTLGIADASGVAITGQFNGIGGVHYYFF